jgi:hypothetical protein
VNLVKNRVDRGRLIIIDNPEIDLLIPPGRLDREVVTPDDTVLLDPTKNISFDYVEGESTEEKELGD